MRVNTNVDAKKIQRLSIDKFKGVDFSSSVFNVDKKRASFSKNFISENGSLRKRKGWTEIPVDPSDWSDTDEKTVHSFIFFEKYIIAHIGTKIIIYVTEDGLLKKFVAKMKLYTHWGEIQESLSIPDAPSHFFMNGEYIYLYLDYLANPYSPAYLLRVKKSDFQYFYNGAFIWTNAPSNITFWKIDEYTCYIPTTTIGILPDESEDTSRSSFEQINRMTTLRKNSCRGVDLSDITPGTYEKWNGDDPDPYNSNYIESFSGVKFTLDGNIGDNGIVTVTITNSNGTIFLTNDVSLSTITTEVFMNGDPYKNFLYKPYNNKVYGVIDRDTNSVILDTTLIDDIKPQTEGEDNIIIEFDTEDHEDYITPASYYDVFNHTKFGMLFGYNGEADRLFLYKDNIEYYSEMDDFTYFPMNNTVAYGTDLAKIVGYQRLNDGTVAVFKENKGVEPSIYYKTPSTLENADGTSEVFFPVTNGSNGEVPINNRCFGSLAGDNLFLSKNGVFGLTLSNNIKVDARYAKERSRYINKELAKHDLSNACAVVFENRFYIAVDRLCFVLDARETDRHVEDMDDTFNYECYLFDNIPATSFFVSDNELWFGTDDGRICKFDDSFTDRKMKYISAGNIGLSNPVDENENSLPTVAYLNHEAFDSVIKNDLPIFIKGTFTLSGISEDDASYFEQKKYFYIKNVRQTENGKEFNLAVKPQGESVIITFSSVDQNEDGFEDNLCGWILDEKGIEAEWYSAVFDLGLPDYTKCFDSFTIALNPDSKGKVNFGYETNKTNIDQEAKKIERIISSYGSNYFTFEDMDFNDFTFNTAFASSFTKRIRERNFNYLMFKFSSSGDKDAGIEKIVANYTIYKKKRGLG